MYINIELSFSYQNVKFLRWILKKLNVRCHPLFITWLDNFLHRRLSWLSWPSWLSWLSWLFFLSNVSQKLLCLHIGKVVFFLKRVYTMASGAISINCYFCPPLELLPSTQKLPGMMLGLWFCYCTWFLFMKCSSTSIVTVATYQRWLIVFLLLVTIASHMCQRLTF